ncbi:MAG: putative esterase family protein [Chloroflexi bacterium OLB15]|nr:MAG: putative esterase family protein [Chloroflexi bacterium OLB15]
MTAIIHTMMIKHLTQTKVAFIFLALCVLLAACDPLAPFPTPTAAVLIVTPEDTATLPPTITPIPSDTPTPSPTDTPAPTPTPDPCLLEGGTVIPFDEFRSEIAGENLRYRVYVPPCYLESQKRYPYAVLLHGLRQDENEWETIGVIEALEQGMRLGAIGPMILVMPYTGQIGAADRFFPDPSVEQVILEELLPAIERDFCTWNDREHRAIGGISRGGFWAYSIAMRHPDIFGRVGGHSAELNAESAPNAVSPLALASNDAFLPNADLSMYLDNASADPAGVSLELFSSRLSARGIPHDYTIYPTGGHDDDYWSSHVSEYISFYGEDWPRRLEDLPSCLDPSP